jgi:hypothetical protein
MLRRMALLIVVAFSAGSISNAAPLNNGTKEEREACAPEVVKFCNRELDVDVSDTAAILRCLQRNRQKISAACRAVLESRGQ